MKVLQVINSLSTGGAEKLLIDSVLLYQKKGIGVDVLCLNDNKTPFRNVFETVSSGSIKGITSKSIYNPILVFKIIPYLRKYDVVHLHLFPTLYWVVLAKWISFSKVKLIYTEHNTSNRRRGLFVFRILDRFIYKKLDAIVTIAEEVDLNLKKHLTLTDNDFYLINNGVDINHYNTALAYSKDLFFSSNDIILIQVSSFRWQKDQQTLIKSLKYLPCNVKLLLVGEGDLMNECVDLVDKLSLNKRVMFLGNRDDVPQLLNSADIVILSSKHEGLSLSNIEGMSVNKPFIGSDVPGLREIVNGYGLLFKQGDEKELANLITKLTDNPDFYKEIAEKCLYRAKEFDINKMIDEYIKLYYLTLGNKTLIN